MRASFAICGRKSVALVATVLFVALHRRGGASASLSLSESHGVTSGGVTPLSVAATVSFPALAAWRLRLGVTGACSESVAVRIR